MMRKLFISLLLASVATLASAFTIVLDAGHGGHDSGALGSFSKEKNINLKIALLVGDLIEEKMPDVRLIQTRNKDVFVELKERANIANRAKADLFVSIHTNSAKSPNAHGMETFTLGVSRSKANMEVAMFENSVILLEEDYEKKYEGFDPNSTDSYIMFEFMKDQYMDRSISLADFVQTNMINSTQRHDRGVRQAGFLVLRATSMPSILIELGFISNREEEKFLNNGANQKKLALAIYNGIADYKHEIDKKNGKGSPVEATTNAPVAKPATQTATKPVVASAKSTEKTASSTTKGQASTAQKETPKPANKVVAGQTEFYVQVLVSSHDYALNAPVFKNVRIDKKLQEGKVYKYLVGPFSNAQDIKKQKSICNKTFPDAFVVAYKNGQKLSVKDTQYLLK